MNRAAGLLAMMRGGKAATTLQRREQVGKVILDWRAYFQAFSEAHGGNPVLWKGRQLFQDGYSYSTTDYAGPEWPAPADQQELRMMQRVYWAERRKIVLRELQMVRQMLEHLRSAQAGRSVPLQQVSSYVAEDGRRAVNRGSVDLSFLEERETWLRDDVVDCDSKLKGLG